DQSRRRALPPASARLQAGLRAALSAQDERGRKLKEARIEGNSAAGFVQFFQSLEGPSKAVLEACWNWGLTHDLLEEIKEVEEVVPAHPLKTWLIADAQIKTDRRVSLVSRPRPAAARRRRRARPDQALGRARRRA